MTAAQIIILMSFLEAGVRLFQNATDGKTEEEINAMAVSEEARTATVRAAFDKEFSVQS